MIRAAALCTAIMATPAAADDTELFVTDSRQFQDSRPNVLLIVDTSGSLGDPIATQDRYDPAARYAGHCDHGRVYWRMGIGAPPECTTGRWFESTALVCRKSLDAFERGIGTHTNHFAQFELVASGRWARLDEREKARSVECEDDSGQHGDGFDPLAVYARNGDESRPWSSDPGDEIRWGQYPADRLYTLYHGNYLNWFHYAPTPERTRLQVLKAVATSLVTRIEDVNMGLVKTNFDQGGSVVHTLEDIAVARNSIIDGIDGITAEGWTPLAETLYEAGQYYAGRNVDYGDGHGTQVSVAGARDPASGGTAYASPLRLGCQKNHIVLVTDGAPTLDVDADSKITALPGFSTQVGPSCDGIGDGACLDDMAEYLFATDLNPNLPGKQNVATYVVGFAADLPLLASTAARGGGAYFTASDSGSLLTALTNVFTAVRDTQTTFTAAAVPVSSFNRLRNRDDLYLAVFRATGATRWPGNVKKYRLRGADGVILDANGLPAIDPLSGWFDDDSRSFWSAAADGSDVALGGAAGRIPDAASRSVFTYLGEPLLSHSSNAVQRSNGLIDEALLGIGDPGDPAREVLIDFIRDARAAGDDGHNGGHTGEPPARMGDPLHGKPVSIAYGGTTAIPDPADRIIYSATNDGFLHAIDARTGAERWAFIAPEFIADQVLLHANEASPNRHYGIDGNIRAHIHADTDGVIEPGEGERVYLFFGMRRGGSAYYGLDVTRPDSPSVLWRIDASTLPGLGQSWSTPVVSRMNIQGARQNARHLVLVVGGGYDPSQDRVEGSIDHQGNALYIIDALSGEGLWHASRSGSDFDTSDMEYSIPADIRVIDLNLDGFADRLYAADMGGQVWRFDVFNGRPAAGLINGGVIARLGAAPGMAAPGTAPPAAEMRRFYHAPDVALAGRGTHRFIHIGIGSGHRARPNSLVTHDRFHALRDYTVFRSLARSDYAATTPITGSDLVDITDNLHQAIPPGSPGWRLDLNDGGWRGEKVLAESRTFNNQVFFTTFTPGAEAQGSLDNCLPVPGTNRLYVVDLFNGDPVRNFDGLGEDTELTADDRHREMPGSIPSEVVFLFPPSDDPDCVGPECAPPPLACAGLLCLPSGFDNAPVRTYWSQEGVQ